MMDANREVLKRKIRFDAARRSSLELELVFLRFLDRYLDTLTYEELLDVEKLLSLDDLELSKAIFKSKTPPVEVSSALWARIIESAYSSA